MVQQHSQAVALQESRRLEHMHAERAAEWYEVLHKRVVEKNLRAIAGCYSRIRTAHLATLLRNLGRSGLNMISVVPRIAFCLMFL